MSIRECFDLVASLASILLVFVTGAYVVLTWSMVKEMQRAREAESEPHLVAALVPLSPMHVKLRIQNAGRGPAMNIKATFRLEPASGTESRTWLHPMLLSGTFEDFSLPGRERALEQLASAHNALVVDLEWRDAFSRKHQAKDEIDLKRQKDGWFKAGFMMHSDDTPTQLGRIREELRKISEHLDRMDSERGRRLLLEEYRRERNPWRRIWESVIKRIGRLAAWHNPPTS